MAGVLVTPLAEADMAEIWGYIASDNRAAADRLIRQISDMFDSLAANPELGLRYDSLRPGLRCKPVKRNYLIFYEVVDGVLRVLRVLHAARDYESGAGRGRIKGCNM